VAADMHERKFIRRLSDQDLAFRPANASSISQEVWRIKFPAWRALFTSLLLNGHSTGYRLPTCNEFYRYCKRAYTQPAPPSDSSHIRRIEDLRGWFDGKYEPQIEERLRVFYESGMAETYLYVCLVDAFEDALNEGVVFYDPRHDWKLKGDVTAVVRGRIFLVSLFRGAIEGRPLVEARRDLIEREHKQNTMNSAHWGNRELKRWTKMEVSIVEGDCQCVNGFRLTSHRAIHELIDRICDGTGIEQRVRFPAKAGEDIPQVLLP
jgi:hypothetical protein